MQPVPPHSAVAGAARTPGIEPGQATEVHVQPPRFCNIGASQVTTGGALGWLALGSTAYKHVPSKRVEHVLREHWNGQARSLTEMAGTTQVNSDLWDGQEEHPSKLVRINNDAESGP